MGRPGCFFLILVHLRLLLNKWTTRCYKFYETSCTFGSVPQTMYPVCSGAQFSDKYALACNFRPRWAFEVACACWSVDDLAPADILEDILEYFAANKWIRRPDIRIFRDFVANEWIRRPDIRIFRDFVTGTGTWYWYNTCAPDPY